MERALKFLNKISVSGAGADSAGEALGEIEDGGEPSGEAAGDADATASGTPGLDGRVPAKVADGACAWAMAEQARLMVIRATVFIKMTSSAKSTGCRFASG
jgi:hypothetical protein